MKTVRSIGVKSNSDCRRFGLFKIDFAVMVCRRFSLSPFRFVAVLTHPRSTHQAVLNYDLLYDLRMCFHYELISHVDIFEIQLRQVQT